VFLDWSVDELRNFLLFINSRYQSIQFKLQIGGSSINFLNLTVTLERNHHFFEFPRKPHHIDTLNNGLSYQLLLTRTPPSSTWSINCFLPPLLQNFSERSFHYLVFGCYCRFEPFPPTWPTNLTVGKQTVPKWQYPWLEPTEITAWYEIFRKPG